MQEDAANEEPSYIHSILIYKQVPNSPTGQVLEGGPGRLVLVDFSD